MRSLFRKKGQMGITVTRSGRDRVVVVVPVVLLVVVQAVVVLASLRWRL